MRKGRDFIKAHQLTSRLRSLYGITRECNDAELLCQYYKALTILADPAGSEPVVLSMHEASYLITDASWSSVTYQDQQLSEILEYAYQLELPVSLVDEYYSVWKKMVELINQSINRLSPTRR